FLSFYQRPGRVPDFNRGECRGRQAAGASVAPKRFLTIEITNHIPLHLLQTVPLQAL
ncbi:hypothetical protein EDC47_1882, partial [Raoultella planticola]